MYSKRILSGLFVAACLSPLAVQAEVTWEAASWTFDSTNCVSTVGPSGNCGSGDTNFSDGRVYQGVGSGVGNVTVTGWANTISSNTQLELGQVTHYGGGLGVQNADGPRGQDTGEMDPPEHAVDNDDRFDMVLFDFGNQLVDLSQITIGWFQQDSDITVLAYTGDNDPTGSSGVDYIGDRTVDGTASEDLTSHGWSVLGNHDVDDGPDPMDQSINGGGIASSYWLVSAYNPVFGGTCTPSSGYCQSDFEDYFKINALSGHVGTGNGVPPGSIPEPAMVLLMSMGLGFLGHRRLKS